MWVRAYSDHISDDDLITQGEYDEMKREDLEKERKRKAALKSVPEKDKWQYRWAVSQRVQDYVPFDRSTVFYDDISEREGKKVEKHNRIALILQGLLDRSEVFHPHPAWRIWDPAGFREALVLEYDESRALVSGPPPDFQAYRARLNASIKAGTVTIGQDRVWALHEGEKYKRKVDRDYRRSRTSEYLPDEHRPYGNPGPGELAAVASATKMTCTYRWTRERDNWRDYRRDRLPCSIKVARSRLLNADAYEKGDFRQFFDDPRTRADYLQWAPMLLLAEEYKAGNRKVGPDEG